MLLSSFGENYSRVLRDPSGSYLESLLIKNFKDPGQESVEFLGILSNLLNFCQDCQKS